MQQWMLAVLVVLAAVAPARRAGGSQEHAGHAPLRLAVVGLVHGHVEGLLWNARERDDLEIVGVYEPDRALFDRMAEKHALDPRFGTTISARCSTRPSPRPQP
jgi:hypothetical protein